MERKKKKKGGREVLASRFRAVDVLEGWRAALLEVISVDYRGRVQRTAAPCNLPP